MQEVDKIYCASSFLMHRTIFNYNKIFKGRVNPYIFKPKTDYLKIHNSIELEEFLQKRMYELTTDGKAALALSGGIDSAILASFMPKGSKTYTFKCIVPGIEVIDESIQAKKYADYYGLQHEVIEIYWEDFLKYVDALMLHKGMPVHSIAIQIYKAALKVKKDGFDKLIFGESVDIKYGGLSNLLSKDYTLGEYIDRFSYVMPYKVLKNYKLEMMPFVEMCKENGYVDVYKHVNKYFFLESMACYENACSLANIKFCAPYSETILAEPLDYERIRRGDSKYLIREIFKRKYSGWDIPKKVPMPRPMNEWMQNWKGPVRPEFWPHCTDNMAGDQKWMVWALERFLNLIET